MRAKPRDKLYSSFLDPAFRKEEMVSTWEFQPREKFREKNAKTLGRNSVADGKEGIKKQHQTLCVKPMTVATRPPGQNADGTRIRWRDKGEK